MTGTRKTFDVACGRRLRQFRAALGYDMRGGLRRFAENTGVPETNLNNWELGNSLVPPWYVQRLKDLFGLSHDWIFGGDASKLPADLSLKLLAARDRDESEEP